MSSERVVNYLTEEKLEELKAQLSNLVDVQRSIILEELKQARSLGDLSENADYDSAKDRQAQLEKKIQEIEAILKNYSLINAQEKTTSKKRDRVVEIGSKVRIYHSLTNQEYVLEILGSLDANPAQHKISNESPIAKTILGKPAGGTYLVEGLKKSYKITILEIL
ncbi:transcription elongation factor GreA [Candidatus Mycoplasma haematominutum]|uniref:Transcription elongation factor GreA n=1 Tax=Candidatus Mycoplasma haematominutum 'Birmingham 1' TaxID=1116213 RepID=G8C343_9MOLU|nr:transcription elongation factor GreA [Candidatus Mycoplasma haematominutum]CCE66741.1 transcription elongation factor GreA [Candidatus Mycoplasma haematominutum 'Birmingham 1']